MTSQPDWKAMQTVLEAESFDEKQMNVQMASSGNATSSSYTGLVRAIESRSIRSATLQDDAHLAVVVY
jgi:hypothetical protein